MGKDAARRVFERLAPNDALTERMTLAVQAQAQSQQWRQDGGRFIPHPRTWLHHGRWQDENRAVTRTAPARASHTDQAAKAARQVQRDAAQTERETALAARLDALAPDERTALEEAARDDLRTSAPYVTPTPADVRRAMLLALARRYRGQPIPAPASVVATGGEER